MPKTIGFRPTREQRDRIDNYMAIQHISDKSEAMRKILDEWIDQKRELETLRNYLKQKSPQPPETIKPSCIRGLTFSGVADKQLQCRKCHLNYPDQFKECQEVRGEKD